MGHDYLHEAEEVLLRSDVDRPCEEVWRLLPQLGYTLHEDVFTLLREKNTAVPRWQSDSVVTVQVLHQGDEIYDRQERWDAVKLTYLLATLPRMCISPFVNSVAEVAAHLGLPLHFDGKDVTPEELHHALTSHAEELAGSIGEPGSEDVRIFIESTYPR